MTEEYKSAVMQAQENLTDLKERGNINPALEAIQKLLAPLGKQLAVVPV